MFHNHIMRYRLCFFMHVCFTVYWLSMSDSDHVLCSTFPFCPDSRYQKGSDYSPVTSYCSHNDQALVAISLTGKLVHIKLLTIETAAKAKAR